MSRYFWNSFSRSHTGIAMAERLEIPGREGEIRLEQALELQERLVVEDDVIDVLETRMPPPLGNRPWHAAETAHHASCA